MAKDARVLLVISVGLGVQACLVSTEPPPFAEVTQAGWSFGFCNGPCRGELDLSSLSLTYRSVLPNTQRHRPAAAPQRTAAAPLRLSSL